MACSASSGSRPVIAVMIAMCSPGEACGRPGRSDSWNWCRTNCPFSRSISPAAALWLEISLLGRPSSAAL